MFLDMSLPDLLTLTILATLLFGPDKLPKVVREVAGALRTIRAFADSAREEVRAELGPEFKDLDLGDLHPRTFVRKHVLDGEGLGLDEIRSALNPSAELSEAAAAMTGEPTERPESRTSPASVPQQTPAHAYDPDAT
ncbi:sec-independent translocase [Streptomyces sp. NPDC004561]